MFKQIKPILIVISLLFSVMLSPVAQAVLINGEMSITGYFVPTGGETLVDATGIDFMDIDGLYGTAGGAFTVGAVAGDFADYITLGGFLAPTIGDIQDIEFASFSAVTPFWQVAGFSFDLLSLTVAEQTADSLTLRGVGEVYGYGFERTMGSWVLTANGGQSTFSWSATTKVPESATLALLGVGFLFMGALYRRKTQA